MTVWRAFLNDKIPDCGVAACCNALNLWYGDGTVGDADAKLANDRFSAADYSGKVLWGWYRRGIGNIKLGGFATIRKSQIPAVVQRFGCALVLMSRYRGLTDHIVLVVKGGVESGGVQYAEPLVKEDIKTAYAIAPKFHPVFIWWAVRNDPRWLLFAAPLWWPQ